MIVSIARFLEYKGYSSGAQFRYSYLICECAKIGIHGIEHGCMVALHEQSHWNREAMHCRGCGRRFFPKKQQDALDVLLRMPDGGLLVEDQVSEWIVAGKLIPAAKFKKPR